MLTGLLEAGLPVPLVLRGGDRPPRARLAILPGVGA